MALNQYWIARPRACQRARCLPQNGARSLYIRRLSRGEYEVGATRALEHDVHLCRWMDVG